jgi:hypothetical protein
VRGGWNVWEGGVQLLAAANLTQKKISNKKYTVTLGGRRSMNLHTRTNQKQAPIMEESKERRGDHQGSARGCKSIVLGAIAVKQTNETKKMLKKVINFFLHQILKVNKIL